MKAVVAIEKLKKAHQQLTLSSDAYDAGYEDEAVRLASTLRALFHSTASQKPLIKHLKLTNTTMLSSFVGHDSHFDFIVIRLSLAGAPMLSSVPKLGMQFNPADFATWWDGQAVYRFGATRITRRGLVTSAANKDGGAHFDDVLEPFYEELSSNPKDFITVDASGLKYRTPPPFDQTKVQTSKNTHLAILRQIAHETWATIGHFKWVDQLMSRAKEEAS